MHLVVQDETVALHGDLAAPETLDGLGHGDHVALLVGDGEGGGGVALILGGVAGGPILALVGDLLIDGRGVVLAGQTVQRHVGKGGVGHVGGAVGKAGLKGLGKQMDVLGGVDLHGADVVVLQHVQGLDDVGAAGGGGGSGDDLIAAVGAGDGDPLLGLVVGQIVGGHHTAVLGNGGHDGLGHLTLVEGVGAALGDFLEGIGQVGVGDGVAHLVGQAVLQIVRAQLAVFAGHPLILVGDGAVHGGADHVAVVGQVDGGLHDLLAGQLAGAELGESQLQAGHLAGDAHGQAADAVGVLDQLTVGIQPGLSGLTGGGHLAVVDKAVLAVGGVDNHESAAAQAGGEGLGHAQGVAHGDGGVHGAAALLQNCLARHGGVDIGGGYHAVFAGRVTIGTDGLALLVEGTPHTVVRGLTGLGAAGRGGAADSRGRRRGGGRTGRQRDRNPKCKEQFKTSSDFHWVSSFYISYLQTGARVHRNCTT